MRPGEHPLRALRARDRAGSRRDGAACSPSTSSRSSSPPAATRRERAAFVDALVAPRATAPRRVVLVAVRADFYGRCAAYPELSRLLGANHVLVGPMRRDELRRAIELPARRAGLSVEPELVDALLADVEGEPGALPLLSTALLELWQRARRAAPARSPPTSAAGGVHGAVARLAEGAYDALDAAQQAVGARASCCGSPARARAARSCAAGSRSTSSSEDARPVARRAHRQPPADGQRRARSRSRTRRCCASGRGCAAGSRRTPRAGGCTATSRDAAREWDADGRDPGELYRGARLAAALDWAADHDPELNAAERALPRRQRGARAGARSAACASCSAGVAALLVLAVIAGVVALDQRGSARERGAWPRTRSASAPRRSPRTTSTARCCSRARASRSTTRCRRAATCSPRCSRARRRSACCAATATG